MAVATKTRVVTIGLEAACLTADCRVMAEKMWRQLDTPNYTRGVAIMPMPATLADWRDAHRTARKRASRAGRLGYRFAEIDRAKFNDDIHAINTSKQQRQGRPMSAGYLQRHRHGSLPAYPCERHRVHTYGVLRTRDQFSADTVETVSRSQETVLRSQQEFSADQLVAYLSLYRIGDLAMVSMILGHGDHLANDIMYALFEGVVADQTRHAGFFYYNRFDSGTDGLRYFKTKLGFRETDIEWEL